MNIRSLAIGSLLALVVGGLCFAQASIWHSGKRFAAYPAPAYHGRRHQPSFAGADSANWNMRPVLTKGFASNPLFAGHYVIVTTECQVHCLFAYVGDVRTGRTVNFPLGGAAYFDLQLHSLPTSRLLKARWSTSGATDAKCTGADMVWNGHSFAQTPLPILPGPCPIEH